MLMLQDGGKVVKERVTLTIDKDLLKRLDEFIDGTEIKNRSHAVELMLTKAMGHRRPKKAFILAGGKTTRLGEGGKDMPRPLLLVHGKPILEHLIELLKKYNITDIIISIGPRGDRIKEYFGSGLQLGVKITYVAEDQPQGTSGPLNLAKPYLHETFIMCNGDELKNINVDEMYAFHKNNNALATLALTTVEDPSNYGVVVMNGNKISDFIEKPSKKHPLSNLISAGFYIMEPDILDYVPTGYGKLEEDVYPKLSNMGKLYGYVFSGQWLDTSTQDKYKRAEKLWKGI